MSLRLTPLLLPIGLLACGEVDRGEPLDLLAFDNVIFYDGYAGMVDEPVQDGMQRLSNAVYTRKLTDEQLTGIHDTLSMTVSIHARCDNYDRLGHVGIAIVPEGASTYDRAEVEHIELARFITPFMDMNRQPDTVDYDFDLTYLADVLSDSKRWEGFDLWLEFDVFGVPYAANEEIPGCAGRNDTQGGTLRLWSSSSEVQPPDIDAFVPLTYKEAFNDYQEGASDEIGATRKTVSYTLEDDLADAQLVMIISHHGANAGGEEYERRRHRVSVDGTLIDTFTPGRDSCEPFRDRNTQGNGIYGFEPRTDEEWQSFSNWCPGDVIDTRIFPLGAQAAGEHTVLISVPQAEFRDDQGNFPLSMLIVGQEE